MLPNNLYLEQSIKLFFFLLKILTIIVFVLCIRVSTEEALDFLELELQEL